MLSCVRNIRTKNYRNWTTRLQVTNDNVGDVFFRTWCSLRRFKTAEGCDEQTDGQTPRRQLRRTKHYVLLRVKMKTLRSNHK